jgi:hypothetical protein
MIGVVVPATAKAMKCDRIHISGILLRNWTSGSIRAETYGFALQ